MPTERREFLQHLTLGAAALTGLAALPANAASALGFVPGAPAAVPPDVDMSWVDRVRGKYRAVFDIPEVESGYGVWRSQLWASQVREVFSAPASEVTTVIVLRHNGIFLAMQQQFWDDYAVGPAVKATHPATQQATTRNPALLSSANGDIDAQYDPLSLTSAIRNGAIVLGCSVALAMQVVPQIAEKERLTPDAALARARALLVPGVIMQPSGVFAAVAAQDAGCRYVRSS